MSYDLEIATYQRPRSDWVRAFADGHPGYHSAGEMGGSGANLLVNRVGPKGPTPAFTIDGPLTCELDDLPESLAAHVLSPRWLVQVSAPAASSKADLQVAVEIARKI